MSNEFAMDEADIRAVAGALVAFKILNGIALISRTGEFRTLFRELIAERFAAGVSDPNNHLAWAADAIDVMSPDDVKTLCRVLVRARCLTV